MLGGPCDWIKIFFYSTKQFKALSLKINCFGRFQHSMIWEYNPNPSSASVPVFACFPPPSLGHTNCGLPIKMSQVYAIDLPPAHPLVTASPLRHTHNNSNVYTGHLNAQTNTVFIETNLASYFGSHIRRSEPRSQALSWMWACPARHREWMDGGLLFWEPTQAPQASSIPPRIVMIGGRPNKDGPL